MRHEAETIERAAEEALHDVADADLRARLGLASVPVAGGVALIAAALPPTAVVANRVLGLGLDLPLSEAAIEEVSSLYREAGVERYFVQLLTPSLDAELVAMLHAAGLERARGWQKFTRNAASPPPPVATRGLEIREIDEADGIAFAEIVCAAFDLGDAAVPWLAGLPRHPDWRAFMAFEGTTPAGAGALFVQGDAGWTDWGATAPAFRRRGVQRALLAERIRAAAEAGCRRLHTCTGEAVPGDPQHSYNNILRCGFEETYVRENWAPPKR